MKYVIGLVIFLYTLVFAAVLYAACTGCGEEGHQQCVEGADHSHATDQDHKHIEGLWLTHKHEVELGPNHEGLIVVKKILTFEKKKKEAVKI